MMSNKELAAQCLIEAANILGDMETHDEVLEEGIIKNLREKLSGKKKSVDREVTVSKNSKKPDDPVKFKFINVTSKSILDDFYRNNDIIIECLYIADENQCQLIANYIKKRADDENIEIHEPIEIYQFTGNIMNEKYDLHDKNRYQDDTHHVVIPLHLLKNMNNASMFKTACKGRYFNDVVDNNEYREYLMGYHPESKQIQWLIAANEHNQKTQNESINYIFDDIDYSYILD